LSQQCRGELDWIVMKALEKDRNRRYESASAFAADVQRYLHDEAVQACPPSALYRLRKFGRRNKAVLLTVGTVTLAVLVAVGGVAGSIGWAVRDREARHAETQRAIGAAVTEARGLLAQGDKEMEYPQHGQRTIRLARLAVERAEGLLATVAGGAELAEQVRQARTALDTAEIDSELLVELDRIRWETAAIQSGQEIGRRVGPDRYAAVLSRYGVKPAETEAAAARVRDSRVRDSLLWALADWAWLTQDQKEGQRVVQVLQKADGTAGPFRSRWWTAIGRRDPKALVGLAEEPEVQDLPNWAVVWWARHLWKERQWAAAERLLRTAQERKAGDFWLNHDLGMVLVGQGSTGAEEAVGYLRAALALRSDSARPHLSLGHALREKWDFRGAVRCYQAALRIAPDSSLAYTSLGSALVEQRRPDEAIAAFHKALDLDAHFTPAHNGLGVALRIKKDLTGALREIHKALALDPRYVAAHDNLGNVLLDQGKLDEAIATYRKALSLDPNSVRSLTNLANALRRKKDLPGAIRTFHQVLALAPRFAPAYAGLGIALAAQGKTSEAIAAYHTALELSPNYVEARNNLGNALMAQRKLDEATACYRKALDIDPNYVAARINLGDALRGKKDWVGANRELHKAIALDPKYASAHNNLGNVLLEQGKLDEAIAAFRKALELSPKLARAHLHIGLALSIQSKLDEAIAEYRIALTINPDYAQAHGALAQALVKQGLFAEARASNRRCLKLLPERHRQRALVSGQLKQCERLLELEQKLPLVLAGKVQPDSAAERLEYAQLCSYTKLHGAAVRLFAAAFTAEARLADNLRAEHRYRAACSAALAGVGLGKDAGQLDDAERACLRRQALDWLRADFAAWGQLLAKEPAKTRSTVQQTLRHWQQDASFAGVRGDALARLPEAERQAWQQFQADVERILKKADRSDTRDKTNECAQSHTHACLTRTLHG
jgi:superkiller protein 3